MGPTAPVRLVRWLAASTARATLFVGAFGFLLAALVTFCQGGAVPHTHDEFSYLLTADTFAHGRVSNPPHPLGQFFETFHVLQRPKYVSKYPPGQGAFLAIGQVLTGYPIVGVWLSYGLMCAALTWMLFGWTRPRWALGGGVFAALYLVGVQADLGNWAASYFGGAVTAIGGALLLGGLRRAVDRASGTAAMVMALGVGLLANTRPYEGLLAALPAGLAFLGWLLAGSQGNFLRRVIRVGAPAALVLGLVAGGMAAYNRAITGSPLKLPYMVYEETYGSTSPFVWGHPRALTYRHEAMRRFYEAGPATPTGIIDVVRNAQGMFGLYRAFYLPLFLTPLLFLVPWALRDRRLLVPLGAVVLCGAGLLVETWGNGHYAAPIVGGLLLLFIGGARRLNLLRIRRAPIGQLLLTFVMACIVVSAVVYPIARLGLNRRYEAKWYSRRADIDRRLGTDGTRHLILVDYGPRHSPDFEWVYNHADIDGQAVVWARSMGTVTDSTLLSYYSNRTAWSLHIDNDAGPFELQPISRASRP